MRFDQLAEITHGELVGPAQPEASFAGVSLDSRTLAAEQLFVAIKGNNTDGHQYVDQAVTAGAAGILSQRGCLSEVNRPTRVPVVEVPDSHAAMIELAAAYLGMVDPRRLGITGSNGKTTTKEFTGRLLRAVTDHVYCSPGNYNNLYGIPLALFGMPESIELAVLEMGISVPGEMSRLAELVRPHVMVVTNVSATHLEFLGSVDNVAREKLAAMAHAQPDAALIVNADDAILMAEAERTTAQLVTFGMTTDADFAPDHVERQIEGTTSVTIEGHTFRLPMFGEYQVMNLLAAYAAVRELGYTLDGVNTEAIELNSAEMRGERLVIDGATFISDCYNANPESVRAGLKSFEALAGEGRRVVILGDMLELGSESARYHAKIGELVTEHRFDLLITVGRLAVDIARGARSAGVACRRILHFETAADCAREMLHVLKAGDLIYLKASRGIGLETVVQQFANRGGVA